MHTHTAVAPMQYSLHLDRSLTLRVSCACTQAEVESTLAAAQAALKQDEFVVTTAHAHNSSKRYQLMVSAVNAKTGDAIVSEQPCVSEEPVAYQPLCT
eukprot:17831-Heterococcus_DN1.PRE.3